MDGMGLSSKQNNVVFQRDPLWSFLPRLGLNRCEVWQKMWRDFFRKKTFQMDMFQNEGLSGNPKKGTLLR